MAKKKHNVDDLLNEFAPATASPAAGAGTSASIDDLLNEFAPPQAGVQVHSDRPASFAAPSVQVGPNPNDSGRSYDADVASYDAEHPWFDRNVVGSLWTAADAATRLPGMDKGLATRGANAIGKLTGVGPVGDKALDLAENFQARHPFLSTPIEVVGAAKGMVGKAFGAASKGANAILQPARPLTRMATETLAGGVAGAGARMAGNAIEGNPQDAMETGADALMGAGGALVSGALGEAGKLAQHDRYLSDYRTAKAGGHLERPEVQAIPGHGDERISEMSRANRDVAFGAAKSKLDAAKAQYRTAEDALEQSGAELDGSPVYRRFAERMQKNRLKATGDIRDPHLDAATKDVLRLVPPNPQTGKMTAEDLVAARRYVDEKVSSLKGTPEGAAWTKMRKTMNEALDDLAGSEPAVRQLREADSVYSAAKKTNREVSDIMTGSGEDAAQVASKSSKRRQAANAMRYAGEGTRPGLDRREEIARLAAQDPAIARAVENQRAVMSDEATRFGLPHAGTHTFSRNIYALPLQQARAVARLGMDAADTTLGRAASAAGKYALPNTVPQGAAALGSGYNALLRAMDADKRRAKRLKGQE